MKCINRQNVHYRKLKLIGAIESKKGNTKEIKWLSEAETEHYRKYFLEQKELNYGTV
jgi:hypothetical protein